MATRHLPARRAATGRARLPGKLATVFDLTVHGTTRRYLTNVLDPTLLPAHEVPALYARRWDIELAYKLLKRELNLHLLWSGKTAVIHQQIWATLIISQVLLALWMEVAATAE